MDPDHPHEAPPPYSAVDPMQLQEQVDEQNEGLAPPQLEASVASLSIQSPSPTSTSVVAPTTETRETSIIDSGLSSEHSAPTVPAQFASAAGYFAERSQPVSVTGDVKRELLIHHMTIYARSHSKDFPRRPRCWNSRTSEINQHDWDTFLNFLFPPHLNPAASSNRLHRQIRAEIERDRKDRAQETDEQRSARIKEVMTEWNDHFFAVRAVHITWTYVGDLEEGPTSSLCPNCYPQATKVSRDRGLGRNDSTNVPIPVSAQQPIKQTIKRRPVAQNSWGSDSQTSSAGVELSPVVVSGGFLGQGRNQARMINPESYQSSASWKSQPVAWAAQMTSIAQQYAAKISNQAQEYGRAMEESALARSRQVEMYSKQVEQDALARARQIEAMTIAKGQKIEQAGDRIASWASHMGKRAVNPCPSPMPTDHSYDLSTYDFTHNNLIRQQQPRSRRQSTASDTSIPSVSSIDTVSSVSDLEPTDLASIRAQLSTLDDYHHHELYDAAVSLRSQLEAMKKSRCTGRFRSHHHHRSWGRWESPEESANREQRRVAVKQESKLLREKFNEIERRAKREIRDMQKARRDMKKRQRQQLRTSGSLMSEQSLHAEPLRPRGMPDRTVSDTNTDLYKEVHVGPTESLDRTISEPITQVARKNTSPSITSSSSTSTTPATTAAVNPHEAAKAWTEAQRLRVKEIQKANKERIKEIQKSYKEHEKQQRKAMKKQSKQRHPTTTAFSGVYSSSTASLETGTARMGSGQAVEDLEDFAVQPRGTVNETSTVTRKMPSQERLPSEVAGTFIAELDGTSTERK